MTLIALQRRGATATPILTVQRLIQSAINGASWVVWVWSSTTVRDSPLVAVSSFGKPMLLCTLAGVRQLRNPDSSGGVCSSDVNEAAIPLRLTPSKSDALSPRQVASSYSVLMLVSRSTEASGLSVTCMPTSTESKQLG